MHAFAHYPLNVETPYSYAIDGGVVGECTVDDLPHTCACGVGCPAFRLGEKQPKGESLRLELPDKKASSVPTALDFFQTRSS